MGWKAGLHVGALGLVMASGAACAQVASRPADRQLVQNICAAVESETIEFEPKRDDVMYQFETLIGDAAGVSAQDPTDIYEHKMGAWLTANMPVLLCDRVNFQPRFGNLLKMAVARQADPFTDRVLTLWHVELNQIDQADGGTVLDYIESKRREAGSNVRLAAVYQRYYDRFRDAGARHARELR